MFKIEDETFDRWLKVLKIFTKITNNYQVFLKEFT